MYDDAFPGIPSQHHSTEELSKPGTRSEPSGVISSDGPILHDVSLTPF